MSNGILSLLPSDEKDHIYKITDHLTSFLNHYFHEYSSFDPVRFPATALTSASENPNLPIHILEQIVTIPVWIFTIDNVIDEKLLPEPVLRQKLRLYEKIVLGEVQWADREDPYGIILLEVTNAIRHCPLYPELKELWEQSYIKMIKGMMFEAYESTLAVDLDVYLEHGLYSIGVPMYVVSTWILQYQGAQLPDREQLEEMMRLSAISIRLANDLRTYEKEKAENNLNAIFIKEMEFLTAGMDEETAQMRAFRHVESMLRGYMDQFYSICDDHVPLKKALHRLTQFSVDFYSKTDFNKVSHEQIRNI
jgi:hypothetical protein